MIKKGFLFLTAFSFTMGVTTFVNEPSAYASSLTPVKNISWTIQNDQINLEQSLIDENIYLPDRKYSDSYTIKSGDTIKNLLRKSQINPIDIKELVYNTKNTDELFSLNVGQKVQIERDQNNFLSRIIVEKDELNTLQAIKREKEGVFDIVKKQREYEIERKYASGKISSSLSLAGRKAGLSSNQIHKLTEIFAWDIDFKYDLKEGDTFSVMYEEKVVDDKVIGTGDIIAAKFSLSGQDYTAFLYDDNGNKKYYDLEGNSLEKAFLRNPIDFARISSTFSKGRLHPIFNKIRAHKGTDYAARTGTPIKTVGDGVVKFIGKMNGYGNVVIVDHGMSYTTLYAHMNNFKKGLKKGERVSQGNVIGYVGSTGYATGPHLHYEFRINNEPKNSLTVKLPNSKPIDSKNIAQFKSEVSQLALNMDTNHKLAMKTKEFSVARSADYFE